MHRDAIMIEEFKNDFEVLEKGYKKPIIDIDIEYKKKTVEFWRSGKIKKCDSKVNSAQI